MFQSFEATTTPQTGGPRLAQLRDVLKDRALDGFVVPRADAHQGEYVADADMRLAWLTGFTGSAGFCVVLQDRAAVFIDGRYRLAVREQVDLEHFTPVDWPKTKLGDWLVANAPKGSVIGFDPWLHTKGEIDAAKARLEGSGVTLRPCDNLVDVIWQDRPAPPQDLMVPYDIALSGESSADKRGRMAEKLRQSGHKSTVLTQPDSIAWLLNTRGSDLGHTPVALAFATLDDSGHAELFIDPAKVDDTLRAHLGNDGGINDPAALGAAVDRLQGPVLVDKSTAPVWLDARLQKAGTPVAYDADPILLAKACKNEVELSGTTEAHLRDGAAVCNFLAWVDSLGPAPDVTEIDVVKQLEAFRAETGKLRHISFDTICGTGANGAIMHYRVTEETNRQIEPDNLLLVDSGAQYLDGTTDITRTLAIGTPPAEAVRAFTLVLKGMITLSMARFPKGVSGRDIDALARNALWQAGLDFDHGTGHGVGVYLSVHEGPQRISRASDVALQEGMILSNEPGYYKPGAFGIRIENLIVVQKAPPIAGGDDREMLNFRTLTFAPIDRKMIDIALLTQTERDWLNSYHTEVLAKLAGRCGPATLNWLEQACAAV
ncbi:aminopeptidase P family protein [Neptunicoccus cionae]|uniref:Xaa-Pro aminopeptidase n=1 Tax=Neptunicoccus cionae TaxID=2035344 RepID=A0A916VMW6_9RHOB|nr:aminopeptidase P family protein [Amylibacter cionae]GGA08131.1 Xaa-Pro aminopeptidase [Amylibacter cionae]